MSFNSREAIRILLLDDSPSHLGVLESAILGDTSSGISLQRQETLPEGLRAVERGGIDLVVLGAQLARGEHADVLTAIHDRAPGVPVLLLSDVEDERAALEAVRHGADDFLVAGCINPAMMSRVVRYAVERAHYERALATSAARLRSLLASIQAPVLAVDEALRVLYCNEAYARTVGLTVGDLEGAVLTELFPSFVGTRSHAAYLAALATGQPQVAEGPCGDCYLRARVFRASSGIVAIAEDITAHTRAEATLRERALELEAKNEELDAFNHTVAHDLRNPLGAIRGFVEQLLDHLDTMSPDDVRRHLGDVLNATAKMHAIIDELLLLADVRRATGVPTSLLDMTPIVHEAVARLSHRSAEFRADVTIDEPLPCALGYAPWVEQVWVNYLSNALEYGGRPPRILVFGAEDGSLVRFCVQDNGGGIPPEDRSALFVPFTRLDGGRTRGHGLGLSIVRRIVQRLGGDVGVTSEPGGGSTFWFTLPRPKARDDHEA